MIPNAHKISVTHDQLLDLCDGLTCYIKAYKRRIRKTEESIRTGAYSPEEVPSFRKLNEARTARILELGDFRSRLEELYYNLES